MPGTLKHIEGGPRGRLLFLLTGSKGQAAPKGRQAEQKTVCNQHTGPTEGAGNGPVCKRHTGQDRRRSGREAPATVQAMAKGRQTDRGYQDQGQAGQAVFFAYRN